MLSSLNACLEGVGLHTSLLRCSLHQDQVRCAQTHQTQPHPSSPPSSFPGHWIPVCHREWWQNLICPRPQSDGVGLRTWTCVKPKQSGRVETDCLVNSKTTQCVNLKTCNKQQVPSALFLNSAMLPLPAGFTKCDLQCYFIDGFLTIWARFWM